jgi:hypothetical protein
MVHQILGPRLAARLALIAATLVGSMLFAPPVFGFCRSTTCGVQRPPPGCERDANGCWNGTPLFWEQQCISFSVAEAASPKLGIDYETAEAAVQRGFGLWPNISCAQGGPPSIAVMSRGPLQCERREYNSTGPNANAVLFRDSGWTHDSQAIALTTVTFSSRTGKILGADIEINSEGYELTPDMVAHVVGHEAGHFFGLDHSPDPDALMFFMYSIDARAVEPAAHADDVAAICDVYPFNPSTVECNFEPEKGFAVDCGGNVTASCAVPPGPPSGKRAVGALALLLVTVAGAVHRWRRRGARGRRGDGNI